MEEEALAKLLVAVEPYTMLANIKLKVLVKRIQEIEEAGLEGDIVQCGCWCGGSGALMAALAPGRHTWLCDCFGKLDAHLGEKDEVRKIHNFEATPEHVENAIRAAGVGRRKVSIVSGDFQKTLPAIREQIGRIALLHIDADWYDSITCVLFNLYDQLTKGGIVLLDDYNYHTGCERALEDYFARPLGRAVAHRGAHGCVWFRRP